MKDRQIKNHLFISAISVSSAFHPSSEGKYPFKSAASVSSAFHPSSEGSNEILSGAAAYDRCWNLLLLAKLQQPVPEMFDTPVFAVADIVPEHQIAAAA